MYRKADKGQDKAKDNIESRLFFNLYDFSEGQIINSLHLLLKITSVTCRKTGRWQQDEEDEDEARYHLHRHTHYHTHSAASPSQVQPNSIWN